MAADARDRSPRARTGDFDGLDSSVLVLNRLWQAVNIVNARRALALVYGGRGQAVDDDYAVYPWEVWADRSRHSLSIDRYVTTTSGPVRVPRVIQLMEYDRVPRPRLKFTRSNVYRRDRHRCQYCGSHQAASELTLDHVQAAFSGWSDDLAQHRGFVLWLQFTQGKSQPRRSRHAVDSRAARTVVEPHCDAAVDRGTASALAPVPRWGHELANREQPSERRHWMRPLHATLGLHPSSRCVRPRHITRPAGDAPTLRTDTV